MRRFAKHAFITIITLACLSFFLLCSCSNSSAPSSSTAESVDNSVADYPVLVDYKSSFEYEGKEIPISNLSIYEEEDDYEYWIWAIAELDLSNLSDKERHYLNDDMKFKIEITNEDSEIDSGGYARAILTDGDNQYLLFSPTENSLYYDSNRESALDSLVTFTVMPEDAESWEYEKFTESYAALDEFTDTKAFKKLFAKYNEMDTGVQKLPNFN